MMISARMAYAGRQHLYKHVLIKNREPRRLQKDFHFRARCICPESKGIERSGSAVIQLFGLKEDAWMPRPHSQDLRDRVIEVVKRGEMSRRAAARRYEVSESTAVKWLERFEEADSREPAGHGGHRPSKLMPHREFLEAARTEKPHAAHRRANC
jgi:transposase-like protein